MQTGLKEVSPEAEKGMEMLRTALQEGNAEFVIQAFALLEDLEPGTEKFPGISRLCRGMDGHSSTQWATRLKKALLAGQEIDLEVWERYRHISTSMGLKIFWMGGTIEASF